MQKAKVYYSFLHINYSIASLAVCLSSCLLFALSTLGICNQRRKEFFLPKRKRCQTHRPFSVLQTLCRSYRRVERLYCWVRATASVKHHVGLCNLGLITHAPPSKVGRCGNLKVIGVLLSRSCQFSVSLCHHQTDRPMFVLGLRTLCQIKDG